jgi:eukaryotic-like serine/threonine-protein kinase
MESVSLNSSGYTGRVMRLAPESLLGEVVGRAYQLDRLIHIGAHLWVFHALSLDSAAPVGAREAAVKVLHSSRPIAKARFEREIEVLGSLPPLPQVVRSLDSGETAGGLPFLALEHVDGLSLEQGMGRAPKLEPRKAVALVAEVCQALSELHHVGVVHQQLVTSNILVDRYRGIKLIDLGTVKVLDRERVNVESRSIFEIKAHRQELSRYLSPDNFATMAPEQLGEISGVFIGDVTPRSDVYSLGALLFQLLTGALPTTMREVSSAAGAWKELLRFSTWRCQLDDGALPSCPGLDPLLAEILAIALRRHPLERHRDARALGELLVDYLRGLHEMRGKPRERAPQQPSSAETLLGFTELFFPDANRPSVTEEPRGEAPPVVTSEREAPRPPAGYDEEPSIQVDFNLSTTEIMEALHVDSVTDYLALLEPEVDEQDEPPERARAPEKSPPVVITAPVVITPPPISIDGPTKNRPPAKAVKWSTGEGASKPRREAAPPPSSDREAAETDTDRATTREVDLNAETRLVDIEAHLPEEVAEIYRRRHKER